MQGLDFVISEARKYGIRLILSLSNNYHDFGGRPQYVNWARAAGASVNSDDEFYTNAIVKGYYKNHVKVKQKTRNQTKHFWRFTFYWTYIQHEKKSDHTYIYANKVLSFFPFFYFSVAESAYKNQHNH